MTACTHEHTAHLRQLSGDPTHTEGIRERFIKAMRRRFRQLRGDVRRLAGYERDVFNLRQANLVNADDIERFPSDTGKTQAFLRWLRDQLREGVLEAADEQTIRDGEHWTATFVRAAYGRGWENAANRLRQRGVDVEAADLERVFNLPVPRRQLRRLYTRTYETLESVTVDTADAVRETLTQGLAEGWNPRKMARELTDEIRDIQHTQAEVLARTETINSYSEATLDRFERAGVQGVTVSGEFATANDDRVCPICESIEGEIFDPEQMRTATFIFEPSESEPDYLAGEYPVKPPVHPQCRCAILPVVE